MPLTDDLSELLSVAVEDTGDAMLRDRLDDVQEPLPKKPKKEKSRFDSSNFDKEAKGVGILGVYLISAEALLSEKIRNKACQYCSAKCGDLDVLNDHLTYAWNKPGYEGRQCAYCGNTKNRLHATKTSDQVATLLKGNRDASDKFFKFRQHIIDQHKASGEKFSAPQWFHLSLELLLSRLQRQLSVKGDCAGGRWLCSPEGWTPSHQ